ncbi:MAG: flagellar biosynthesis anti-sigma factor FlgM [Comamonadaceae bacterium]
MSNPVSQYGYLAKPDSFSRSASDKAEKKAGSLALSAAGTEAAAAAPTAPGAHADDVLNLSNVTERLKAAPEFDRAKVEAIKTALQNGQYPLNPRRIAESFVALEQLIRD